MISTEDEATRAAVRDHYASVVTGTSKERSASAPNSEGECCAPSCCGKAPHLQKKKNAVHRPAATGAPLRP